MHVTDFFLFSFFYGSYEHLHFFEFLKKAFYFSNFLEI
jgi:hypothetical protein